jgi:hypothetical protein
LARAWLVFRTVMVQTLRAAGREDERGGVVG